MRILHTSDWHIGKKLKEHDRLKEFRNFFDWLKKIIVDEKIDALIAAGDIFDNKTPSIESQELYYSFLGEVSGKSCRHVVITSGNHDSAQFIDAPAGIMTRCDVHVVGCAGDNEVITLKDSDGKPELIVCAVPFLNDRDIRTARADDDSLEIERAMRAGIMNHYSEVFARAREVRGSLDVPIVAMGHLFLEAGKTRPEEGEHSLYVGTAIKVGTDIFPEDIAYTALGHLHSPQSVGRENIRYSGSPIALTFGELDVQKTVSVVDFDGRDFADIREIAVPTFQLMKRVSGDMAKIEAEIEKLSERKEPVWVEVTYTGSQPTGDIRERLDGILSLHQNIEVLSTRNESKIETSAPEIDVKPVTLENIKPLEMLSLYFNEKNIDKASQEIFTPLYKEILVEMGINY
ncbi:MAG: exonuclease SbcCD subunit D C-terminal domain-containing protein [Synergistaceae bacterium]|nr:exonuclease SbcCD subunit D C-terminal domain-containing protein [Synergistaceae bacterium]